MLEMYQVQNARGHELELMDPSDIPKSGHLESGEKYSAIFADVPTNTASRGNKSFECFYIEC